MTIKADATRSLTENFRATFGRDFLASVVVFLVALPLCMGISIASGMPPTTGIITGIIGGIVVGVLAGSPLQVSGPAAGLSVLVLQFVQEQGADMLGVVVLAAGAMQIAAGLFKFGQWFRAVSPSVIYGMLAGIGVLILASQFHVMLDYKPIGTGIQNLFGIPGSALKVIEARDEHFQAGLIGILTIAAIAAWSSFAPKKVKIVPAPLVGALVGMLGAALFHLTDIKYIEVPSNIWSVTVFPTTDKLMRLFEPSIFISAVSIAFIASAETLLCATAVDQMHRGPRTKYDRELTAQGIGNALCGLRQWERAAADHRECVRIAWRGMSNYDLAYGLWNLPRALLHLRRPEQAVPLFAFAEAHWRRNFGEFNAEDDFDLRRIRRLAAQLLPSRRARELWQQGAALTLAEAVALALA